jgi:limonene-1,2-epoxide hydrolase
MPDHVVTGVTDAGIDVVSDFLRALGEYDVETVSALIADDLVYENVGYQTVHGAERAIRLFAAMQRWHIAIHLENRRAAADGSTVLTERVDTISLGPIRVRFWVCGVFEVHDGRITLWRDYFDVYELAKATVRGLVEAIQSRRALRAVWS